MSHRFTDQQLESITIGSNWRSELKTRADSTQTEAWQSRNAETQFPITKSIEIQAISSRPSSENCPAQEVDQFKLKQFLKDSANLVQQEIRDSLQFEQLSSSWLHHWDGSRGKGIKLERKLTSKYLDELLIDSKSLNGPTHGKQVISGLTWNRPQTSLVVSYKVDHHSDWCTHKTFILIWNLFGRSDHFQKPYYTLEVDGCSTSIQAHPNQGSLYAVGLYNGILMVFDTRLLEPETVSDLPVSHCSPNRVDLHQDSICGLHWIKPGRIGEFGFLVSFSCDGLIVRWTSDDKAKLLVVLDVFNILLQDLPKSMGLRNFPDQISPTNCNNVPIISFSFEPDDETSFVVGCEAGALFRCSLNGSPRGDQSCGEVQIKNPIVMSYAPHRANVKTIEFSPNLRKIFFSVGIDNELRIWDLFQSRPLFVVHCEVNIISGCWLYQRNAILGVQEDGLVSIYQANGKVKPKLIHRFSLEERKIAEKVWNNRLAKVDQIAISDDDNQIHLYDIQLTNQHLTEIGGNN